jgi:O-antigen/teichoic acid export membrane protein
MITQKRDEDIKENLNYLIGATIQFSIFICFQMLIFTDTIIKYWLGSEFIDAIPVMRIIFLSIIFSLFCGAVGSILEASKVKPINLINSCISLGVFLIISGILLFLVKLFPPIISLSVAFTSGLICLGILTYISIRKIYPEKLKKDLNYLWIAIGINILLGSIAFLTKSLVASRFYYLVIFEILIGVIYLLILWLLKIDWLRKVPEKILLSKN